VRLTLNGKGVMKRVSIDPSLMKPEEAAIVEDLVIAAHNDAKSKLERFMQDEMGKVAGGLPLPPGFKLPF
jgi:nucleoid-associated protein EbfC